MRVDGTVRIDGSFAKGIDLTGIRIGQDMTFTGTIDGELTLEGARIGGQLHVPENDSQECTLTTLNLRGATCNSATLSGTVIAATADLSSATVTRILKLEPKLFRNASVDLRNATLGTIIDSAETWPRQDHLFLRGAQYERIMFDSQGRKPRPRLRWATGCAG